MKRLTFEDAHNEANSWPYRIDTDAYAIDFNNGGRKYKQVEIGMRVYEGGMVTLGQNTYRRPELRYRMRKHYGIYFLRVADTSGMKFTDPEGTRIKKSYLNQSTVLLFDYDHNVAVGLKNYRTKKGELAGAYYPHWSAIPVGRSMISGRVRNHAKEEQWLHENDEFLKLCVTTHAMMAGDSKAYKYHEATKLLLSGRTFADDEGVLRMRFSIGAEYQNGDLFKQLRFHCMDSIEVPYFKFTQE